MSLSDRDKKIIYLMVPVLVAAAYWFLLLKPKRHEAVKLSDQVAQAQEARDSAVSQANQLTQAKARYQSDYSAMVRLGKALPTKVDMPSLLVQLNAAAKGTGIQFGAITVGARATAAPIATSTGTSASGASSATVFGAAVQKAKAANAAESSSVAQSAAASNAVGTTGASGATGATGPTGATGASAATSTAPTLDEVPLTFKFGGTFFDLADFFHHLKRFVHVANDRINVQGRLITIDSLKFTSTTFPSIEADVSATVYLSPKNDVATPTATSTGAAGEQSAAISAVSSTGSSTQ